MGERDEVGKQRCCVCVTAGVRGREEEGEGKRGESEQAQVLEGLREEIHLVNLYSKGGFLRFLLFVLSALRT